MQVTLSLPFDIRGKRIRATNSNNERVEYYPYQRTTALGKSTHLLVASSIPLFAQTTWILGYFRPTLRGTIFSGLALQNLNPAKANVVLNLYTKAGVLLATKKVLLGTNVSMGRDWPSFSPECGRFRHKSESHFGPANSNTRTFGRRRHGHAAPRQSYLDSVRAGRLLVDCGSQGCDK